MAAAWAVWCVTGGIMSCHNARKWCGMDVWWHLRAPLEGASAPSSSRGGKGGVLSSSRA